MKLEYIKFGDEGFRKLRNLNIEISKRITVIAGHNGIGKSTILGLIANCSGLSTGSEKTLFQKHFQSNFQEVFFLDYYSDLDKYKGKTPKFILCYTLEDDEKFYKSCSVSAQKRKIAHTSYKSHMVKVPTGKIAIKKELDLGIDDNTLEEKSTLTADENKIEIYRLRIIPRSIDGDNSTEVHKNLEQKYSIGGSMKMPIPTLYLGMSRMSPIGEFETELISKTKKNISQEDVNYLVESFNKVLPNSRNELTEADSVHFHSFSQSKKQSITPNFSHNSLAISLGQDSVSSIISALGSFNNLKRTQKENYKGGILVIDEIEAGLHPKAQINLINLLISEAAEKRLNLQIILTSHSLTIIKRVLENSEKNSTYSQDSVVYLYDTTLPKLMDEPNYTKIKNDMLLNPLTLDAEQKEPELNVYFEDMEALFFFQSILNHLDIKDTYSKFGYKLHCVSANLGAHNLHALNKSAKHFQSSLIILDGDMSEEQLSKGNKGKLVKAQNICTLPSKAILTEETKENLPPDQLIYYYLKDKIDHIHENVEFWTQMPSQFTTDNVRENIIYHPNFTSTPIGEQNRKFFKNWFNENKNAIEKSNVMKHWCTHHNDDVQEFISRLSKTIDNVNNNSGHNA